MTKEDKDESSSITIQMNDYIHPTFDSALSWQSVSDFDSMGAKE